MNSLKKLITVLLIFSLSGCTPSSTDTTEPTVTSSVTIASASTETGTGTAPEVSQNKKSVTVTLFQDTDDASVSIQSENSLPDLSFPSYDGRDYIEVNGNRPYFTDSELTTEAFERYSELDALGRCGTAYACIGKELMPTEPRGEIGMIKPSGWHTSSYDKSIISDIYLYNRCHLIGYQLTGENANELNLITGTRYMNIGRMEDLENSVAGYIRRTGNHVQYRVTPIFENSNLVASGVLMEAYSIEDNGAGICFCNYVFNIQPNIVINYADGSNHLAQQSATTSSSVSSVTSAAASQPAEEQKPQDKIVQEFVLNKNTKKYHTLDCPSVNDIKPKNKATYSGTVEDVENMGYSPCKRCH